jgi:alpha-galactosidase
VTGAVAADRSDAVFVVAVSDSPLTQAPAPVRLAGLDPVRRYRVREVAPTQDRHPADLGVSWMAGEPVVTTGALLIEAGLRLPTTAPETAYVFRVEADSGSSG